jgi:hypothetical protein
VRLRAVYYPKPQGEEERELEKHLAENAALVRADAVCYGFGEEFETAGISLCIHSEDTKHSQVPMRAVSAQVNGDSILYLSSGITHSEHIMKIREAARKADMLIIGAAGPKNALPLHFTAKCTTVLPSYSVYGEVSEKYGALLEEIEVFYSADAPTFDIRGAD